MAGYKPGDKITVTYLRDGKTGTSRLTLGANPDDPSKPLMGVYAGTVYHFPVNVTINVDPNIGGPSAGLVLSLAIYDKLTPGSLVGDVPIAGTGTIDADGKVGPIGGIQQKIRAASRGGREALPGARRQLRRRAGRRSGGAASPWSRSTPCSRRSTRSRSTSRTRSADHCRDAPRERRACAGPSCELESACRVGSAGTSRGLLFALVDTAALAGAEPGLAAQLGIEAGRRGA